MDTLTLVYGAAWATLFIALVIVVKISRIVVYIPNDKIGIVEKLWSFGGSVGQGSFISVDGKAGFKPDVMRGGFAFFFPFQYRIHKKPMVTVPQGTVAYVFARGGAPLEPGQALAKSLPGVSFEDARSFLALGGQKGPQRTILREGIYAINLAQFIVFTAEADYSIDMGDRDTTEQMRRVIEERDGFTVVVIKGHEDSIGVVTVHDGPSLGQDDVIAPTVGVDRDKAETYHNSFQDPEKFLLAGGYRGRQEQVLLEGTYYINRLFATIEIKPKTVIDIGFVGVVVSYTGAKGDDLSGEDFKHGQLVEQNHRGVWKKPLQPGKYAINPYACSVHLVPTTNFVLRWERDVQESHGYDANLSEIKLITKDAFEPILPLSFVIHIAYDDAPLIIQQFAEIRKLVEQTLDPMVSAYFKDTAQTSTLLEVINERAQLQKEALAEMGRRLQAYRINLREVMIGTPRAEAGDTRIPAMLDQVRERQLAVEQIATFEGKKTAAESERSFNDAAAIAANQSRLTASKIGIEIASNEGDAEVRKRSKAAEAVVLTAKAAAEQTKLEGEAEASKIQAIGTATASATKANAEAYGDPTFQLQKELAGILANAIVNSSNALVPQVTVGGAEAGSSNVVDALMALALNNLSTSPPGQAKRARAKPKSVDDSGN